MVNKTRAPHNPLGKSRFSIIQTGTRNRAMEMKVCIKNQPASACHTEGCSAGDAGFGVSDGSNLHILTTCSFLKKATFSAEMSGFRPETFHQRYPQNRTRLPIRTGGATTRRQHLKNSKTGCEPNDASISPDRNNPRH